MALADGPGPDQKQPAGPKLAVDAGVDGGEFSGLVTDSPIQPGEYENAFEKVYRLAGLNPDEYRIVDDTVRFSSWQQSARAADGSRDLVTLYSYRARFQRIKPAEHHLTPEVLEAWRAHLRRTRFPKPRKLPGGTYSIKVADPQLGKRGTEEALKNWKRGVTRHLEAAARFEVGAVHVAFMGDEHEGVANNYTNQPHTVELNQSEQIELDFDMRIWTLKQALTLGVPVSASSVISNHGEHTRNGGKDPVTTRNDNGSTMVARLVRKHLHSLEGHGVPPVSWTIGDGHPGVTVELDGVLCYFTHGYVEKGRGVSSETRMRNAIERQILGRTRDLGEVKVWFAAHYHHSYSQEFEGRTLFGCPALEAEGSSEYMLDQYGVWSPPGMLGMVITRDSARGWEHKNIY